MSYKILDQAINTANEKLLNYCMENRPDYGGQTYRRLYAQALISALTEDLPKGQLEGFGDSDADTHEAGFNRCLMEIRNRVGLSS
jgi:hypothetical protein